MISHDVQANTWKPGQICPGHAHDAQRSALSPAISGRAAIGVALFLLICGCATAPSYPPPAADKAQVVVKVTATPKAGVQAPRTEGQYDKESVEKGRRFTRVNYSKMDCIAVVLIPKKLHSEPRGVSIHDLDETTEIEVLSDRFGRDLSLAYLTNVPGAFKGNDRAYKDQDKRAFSKLVFKNNRNGPVTLFGAAQGNSDVVFEVHVPANDQTELKVYSEGLYDVSCDEDERLFCQVLITGNVNAELCESGGNVFFDNLGIGEYEVEVYAPRLPIWRTKINTTAGKRETLYAEVTVNKLPKAK